MNAPEYQGQNRRQGKQGDSRNDSLIGFPLDAMAVSISVPAANAALNNLLAAGIVSLVNERQWGRVFQATQVLQRLDQLPAPRHA